MSLIQTQQCLTHMVLIISTARAACLPAHIEPMIMYCTFDTVLSLHSDPSKRPRKALRSAAIVLGVSYV